MLNEAPRLTDLDSVVHRFVMFYEAVSADGGRSISIAVSKDGIGGWQRLGRPILEPSDAGWDSGAVGCPCPVSMAGAILPACLARKRRAGRYGEVCCQKETRGESWGGVWPEIGGVERY